MSTPTLKWESLDDDTQRAKVFGGWLIKAYEPVAHANEHGNVVLEGYDYRLALQFIPDPNYEWELETLLTGEL